MTWLHVLVVLSSQPAAEWAARSEAWSSRVHLFPHRYWYIWHTFSKKGCCMAFIWASRAFDVQTQFQVLPKEVE